MGSHQPFGSARRFTVDGQAFCISPQDVVRAMDGIDPEPISKWAVNVSGNWYPVKQVFAQVTGLGRLQFITSTAREKLESLGFALDEQGAIPDQLDTLNSAHRDDVDCLVDAVRSMEVATLLPGTGEYGYPNLPLCLIDAVFSIGIRYTTTRRVVEHFTAWWDGDLRLPSARSTSLTASDLSSALADLAELPDAELRESAKHIFGNLNRTSSRGGILKAHAVALACEVLLSYGVDTKDDLLAIAGDGEFEAAFRSIPGQASGVSLRYLYMLAGDTEEAKPDRMILRFIQRHIGRAVTTDEAVELVKRVCHVMQEDGIAVRVRDIGNAIWRTESSSGTSPAVPSGTRPSRRSKYAPLADFLKSRSTNRVDLTFAQIEEIIGKPLPPSASKHPAFWANHYGGTAVWATAWMDAGWRVDGHSMQGQKVTFVRAKG